MEHHLNHTVDSRATTDTSTCNSRGRTTKELFTRLWDVDSIGFTSFDQRWIVLCRLDTIQVVFGMRACFKHLNNCRYLIEANIVRWSTHQNFEGRIGLGKSTSNNASRSSSCTLSGKTS